MIRAPSAHGSPVPPPVVPHVFGGSGGASIRRSAFHQSWAAIAADWHRRNPRTPSAAETLVELDWIEFESGIEWFNAPAIRRASDVRRAFSGGRRGR